MKTSTCLSLHYHIYYTVYYLVSVSAVDVQALSAKLVLTGLVMF